MVGNLLSILKQRDTHKQKKNIWQIGADDYDYTNDYMNYYYYC